MVSVIKEALYTKQLDFRTLLNISHSMAQAELVLATCTGVFVCNIEISYPNFPCPKELHMKWTSMKFPNIFGLMYVDSMHVLNHTLLIQTFLSVTNNASLTFTRTRFQITFTCSQLLVVSLGSAVLNTMQIYQHQHHNPWDVDCTFTIATASAKWASYQIRKITSCACAGNARIVFPATDFKGNL